LAGLLDWRFQGVISGFLGSGFLTGRTGECAYLPVERGGVTYHLVLVGADSRDPASRLAQGPQEKSFLFEATQDGHLARRLERRLDEFFTKI